MPGRFPIGWPGGHLGDSVSALIDGQLDEPAAERAWQHVAGCPGCRRLVEREGWMKTRLAELSGQPPVEPPTWLLGSLYQLEPAGEHSAEEAREAWAAVGRLEERGRGRRRAGLALVGAGSVSAAVLGLSTLTGATLGIGGAPAGPPASSLSRPAPSVQPSATAQATPARPRAPRAPSVWQTTFPAWLHGAEGLDDAASALPTATMSAAAPR